MNRFAMHSRARVSSLALGFGWLATLCGCLSRPPDNIQPVARITVNGMVAQSGNPPLVLPPGAMVTLDGTTSLDPDGALTAFEWWNTGRDPAERFPPGSTLQAGAMVFRPDLGVGPTVSVPATAGAVYSLYVIDDNGEVSAPATVKFQAAAPAAMQ